MSTRTGRVAPLQIRSQHLAAVAMDGVGTSGSGISAFSMQGTATAEGKPARRHWRERDLRRAFEVARRAGLGAYRVEIAPDGTISIVVTGSRPRGRR